MNNIFRKVKTSSGLALLFVSTMMGIASFGIDLHLEAYHLHVNYTASLLFVVTLYLFVFTFIKHYGNNSVDVSHKLNIPQNTILLSEFKRKVYSTALFLISVFLTGMIAYNITTGEITSMKLVVLSMGSIIAIVGFVLLQRSNIGLKYGETIFNLLVVLYLMQSFYEFFIQDPSIFPFVALLMPLHVLWSYIGLSLTLARLSCLLGMVLVAALSINLHFINPSDISPVIVRITFILAITWLMCDILFRYYIFNVDSNVKVLSDSIEQQKTELQESLAREKEIYEIESARQEVMDESEIGYKWIVDLDSMMIKPDRYMARIHTGTNATIPGRTGITAGEWYPFDIIYDWTPEEYQDMVRNDAIEFGAAVRKGEDATLDVIHPHYYGPAGDIRWFNIIGKAKRINGKLYAVGIAFDVTSLLIEQERLAQTTEDLHTTNSEFEATMEELAQSMEELELIRENEKKMLAVIGHELRTPAATIKMLIDDLENLGDGKIEALRGQAEHLVNVLEDLRVVAQPQEQMEAAFIVTTPCEFFKEAIDQIRPLVDSSSFEFFPIMPKHPLGITTKIPERQMRQVLSNLVKNAVKHSGGTEIYVEVKTSVVTEGKVNVQIDVKDNGRGIPLEERDHIFDSFVRGKKVTADGTGLGLSIVKNIVNSIGGSIAYVDNNSGGAIFRVKLAFDIVEGTESDKLKRYGNVDVLKGRKILIVEDNKTIQMLTQKVLEKKGAKVEVSDNGREALTRLQKREFFNYILSDIMMPEMDGYEFVKHARDMGFKNPIIGLTAATIGEEQQAMLDAGADAVLAKPINIIKLQEELIRVIHTKKS